VGLEQKYLDRIRWNYEIKENIEIIKPVTEVTEIGRTYPQNNINFEREIEREQPQNNVKNDGYTLPVSVTSVTSVTPSASASLATDNSNNEAPLGVPQQKGKCAFPNCEYETEPFYMKLHIQNAHTVYNCPVCVRRKKKRFKTSDLDEYKKHWAELRHKGEPY